MKSAPVNSSDPNLSDAVEHTFLDSFDSITKLRHVMHELNTASGVTENGL